MNIKHLINTEMELARVFLNNKRNEIDKNDSTEMTKSLEKLQLPNLYEIVLVKLLQQADLMSDENKLELMNGMIYLNNEAVKHLSWMKD